VQRNLDRTFVALGDATRLKVVGLLRKSPLRSGEIAAALGETRPTMSRHLRILRKAGLVEEDTTEEDARTRVYRLKPKPFADMRSWLDDVEAFWGVQLDVFKAHVEAKHGEKKSGRR